MGRIHRVLRGARFCCDQATTQTAQVQGANENSTTFICCGCETKYTEPVIQTQYIYDEKFTDIWSKGPCIHQIRYVEELRLLLVVETGASVIKIFDEHCNFKHEFNPPSTFTASLPEGQQKGRKE